jgi:DNA-binding NtrC family response regulator
VKERRGRVLIVEDDTALADMYRTALRLDGFEVSMATDGISALSRLEQDCPDLVVLDLHLPRLRGEAILKEISALCGDIPVIVVTGTDPQATLEQASAILRKPCTLDRLLSVIERELAA